MKSGCILLIQDMIAIHIKRIYKFTNLNMNMKFSPFLVDSNSERAYQQWRKWKLSVYPKRGQELMVDVENPYSLSKNEIDQFRQCFIHANMAIYTINNETDFSDKKIVEKLGAQLGLNRLDSNLCADKNSISSVEVIDDGRKKGYIPYSNLKLSWHTDGYYNSTAEQIHGFILHCVHSAAAGGENALLDHEMLYIHLRDENPAYITALMQKHCLSIPANIENGVEIRRAQTGPVFSIDKMTGSLHMRYSARKKNINWYDDKITQAAANAIDDFFCSDSSWIHRYRLSSGQGVICNNILHNRSAFTDDNKSQHKRLIYRGRYFDRIEKTSFNDICNQMSL